MRPKSLAWPGSWVGHIPFASWLVGVFRPAVFVELGTHSGNSYNAFCQAAVEQGVSLRAFAVDTWHGDAHAGAYDNVVFENFSAHHLPLYGSFSTLLRMRFDEALPLFDDGTVDLLHIDGLHTYEAVRHDFESWLPKLSSRGVVLLHDIEIRRDDFGVFRLWDELSVRFPSFAFRHSNGLGVLMVGQQPSPILLALSGTETPGSDQSRARDYFEALGLRLEQEVALADQAVILRAREEEIENLRSLVIHRDRDVTQLRSAVDARTSELAQVRQQNVRLEALRPRIAELELALIDSDAQKDAMSTDLSAHAAALASIRRSTSWRVTAPLRLAGLLMRGRFAEGGQRIVDWGRKIPGLQRRLLSRLHARWSTVADRYTDHSSYVRANDAFVNERNILTAAAQLADASTAQPPAAWPRIDISVVTYNSQRWIESFVKSLEALEYPADLIRLRFVDNQSTDATAEHLRGVLPRLEALGMRVELLLRPNLGFGAGHNAGLAGGDAPFCLVTNIDLEFEPQSLRRIVSTAAADAPAAVTWEFRQKPYEHPKYYDPVTMTTGWNSHACVLIRRSAFEAVGGYDKNLFMYGEDVELSWRLRREGGTLRYCPSAVVMHYSYEAAGQIKPLQYTGSKFANLYLRLKYGSRQDLSAVPSMGLALIVSPEPFPGARRAVLVSLLRLLAKAPCTLLKRKSSSQTFVFRGWDYELARDGAFVAGSPLPNDRPLVSVITRSYSGRGRFLRQAMLSVAHQTWPNIEHVIVEDGRETLRPVVNEVAKLTGSPVRYLSIEKAGRSATGNAGLDAALGRWCIFLDDDDLLFADHVETLVKALQESPGAVAAYSPALEVVTKYPACEDELYHEMEILAPVSLRQPFSSALLRNHNFMAIQSVLFERSLFIERGGFELDMDALEDWLLWNLYACHNTFVYVPKATSLFRTPADKNARRKRNQIFVEAFPLAKERVDQLMC